MSESLPGRIVVCGHLCLDIILSFPASGGAGDWFRPGRLSQVEAPDVTSGIRSWNETVARIEGGWKRAPAGISEAGWTERADGLWSGPNDAG